MVEWNSAVEAAAQSTGVNASGEERGRVDVDMPNGLYIRALPAKEESEHHQRRHHRRVLEDAPPNCCEFLAASRSSNKPDFRGKKQKTHDATSQSLACSLQARTPANRKCALCAAYDTAGARSVVDCAGSVTCVGSHTAVRTATRNQALAAHLIHAHQFAASCSSSHLDAPAEHFLLLSPLPSFASPQSPKMSEEIVLPLWEARGSACDRETADGSNRFEQA